MTKIKTLITNKQIYYIPISNDYNSVTCIESYLNIEKTSFTILTFINYWTKQSSKQNFIYINVMKYIKN